MNFTRIDQELAEDFASVLPEQPSLGTGVSIGAYDDDGGVCGAVTVSFDGERYDIDWLYVDPAARLQGVGRALIEEVRKLIGEIGFCPLYARFDTGDDNGLYEFFTSIDNDILPVDITFSHVRMELNAADIYENEYLKKYTPLSFTPIRFWNASEELKNTMLALAEEHLTVLNEEKLKARCAENLCLAIIQEGNPLSFMLVEKTVTDDLVITYLFSKDPKALLTLIKIACTWLKQNYKDKTIYFDTISPEGMFLAEKLFPNEKKLPVYEAEL